MCIRIFFCNFAADFKLANYRLMITIEQLKDVQQRADKLKAYLQIDEKRIQLEEEELHTQVPGFWDDAKAAEAQMRKVKGIKRWIEGYEGVRAAVEELALAFDYYKEELVTEEEVDAAYAKALTEVEAIKSLKGGNLNGDDFEFEIVDGSGTTIATALNAQNGTIKFDNLHFDAVGEFTYQMKEVMPGV